MNSDTQVVPGAGAGIGATATLVRTDDVNGVMRLITGVGTSPDSPVLSLTYSSPFEQIPYAIIISPANSVAAKNFNNIFVPLSSVTQAGFDVNSGGSALPEGAEFDIYYSAGF